MIAAREQSQLRIWTIGHSTRSLDAFIDLLRGHGMATLVDVRRYPGSRRYPHFNSEALGAAMAEHGLRYVHMSSLGGRRTPSPDSINTGWRNDQFRAYADYMQTPEFAAALDELITLARASPTAIMCAEAVPWRCHRRLIADALVVRGWEVLDIVGAIAPQPHVLTSFAAVSGVGVSYPSPEPMGEMELFRSTDQG